MTDGLQRERPPVSIETATAAALLFIGSAYAVAALREGLGTLADTGAGFFPFVIAVVLVPTAAVVLRQELRGTVAVGPADEDDEEFHGEVHWARIAGVVATAALIPAVGDVVGLVTTLGVALIAIAKIMGLPGWRGPVLLGVAFAAATWLVFVYWLFVPLPAGQLGLV